MEFIYFLILLWLFPMATFIVGILLILTFFVFGVFPFMIWKSLIRKYKRFFIP